jgi:hypothetical protein|tara:strand:+ start:204 stop:740 length:537 start_codon:yes stop_codon:yes gene_type:complete
MKNTKEIEKELHTFAKAVVTNSKQMLKNHTQTGNLEGSIGYGLKVMPNSFSLSFFMADYGMFLDEGVRGAGGVRKTTSKYNKSNNKGKIWKQKAPNSRFSFKTLKPPLSVFEKYTSNRSMLFAIQESVFRQGIKPTMFFTKPFQDAFDGLPELLIEKFGLDIDEFIESTLQATDTKVN